MRNYWLDKKKEQETRLPTVGDLQEATVAFIEHKTADNAKVLCELLRSLADAIIDYFGPKINIGDRRQATVECMSICFQKVRRFKPGKGKAFNFFTTIMLGHLRQLYRTRKAHEELLARQKGIKK